MEGVLESTVWEGDESMTKVPEITLRYIDDVEDFTPFVDWLHHNIKGWNPTSKNANCFVCARCHKDLPFEEGGFAISFKVDVNGWNLYVEPITKSYEVAMCIPCLREFGMNGEDIDCLLNDYKPQSINGRIVI